MDNPVPAPNIFINPQEAISANSKQRFNPKIVFITLGVIVVVGIGVLALSLFRKDSSGNTPSGQAAPADNTSTSNQVNLSDQASVLNGKIILETPKIEVKAGESVPVKIKLDTGAQVADGVDVVLKFDNKLLEADSKSITTGTIFPEFPVSRVDADGTVRITAITSLQGEGFSGEGVFASVNFKAVAKGKAAIKVDFTKGSTTDTNIVGTQVADDMLSEVTNLEVNIK